MVVQGLGLAVQGLGPVVQVARVQGLAVLVAAVLGWVGVHEQETGRPQLAYKAGQQRHSRMDMWRSQLRACCSAATCYAAGKQTMIDATYVAAVPAPVTNVQHPAVCPVSQSVG
jgi:hypothetical protein